MRPVNFGSNVGRQRAGPGSRLVYGLSQGIEEIQDPLQIVSDWTREDLVTRLTSDHPRHRTSGHRGHQSLLFWTHAEHSVECLSERLVEAYMSAQPVSHHIPNREPLSSIYTIQFLRL